MAKKYALLIGNDCYTDFPDLKVPAADVAGLRRVLADPGIGGFGDDVRVLMNPDLRPAQEAISELFARRTRDDLVLLYFSGHGEPDRGKRGALYLALPESRRDRLRATALPCDFIKTELDECQAGRQILILDCCYAGAIGEKGGAIDPACFGDPGQPSPAAGAAACNGYGRVTLTSSTATQTSWEGNQVIAGVARSLFTHFLIQGLETGEAAQDRPQVSIGQLYRYAHDRVVAATAAAGGKRMDPQYWVHRQQGELIIARNPRPPVVSPDPKDLLDADLLADLACGNHRTRVGAVRELTRLMRRPDLTAAVRGVLHDRLAAERDFEVRALIDEALAGPVLTGSMGSIAAPVGARSAQRTLRAPVRSPVRTAAPAADAVLGNTSGHGAESSAAAPGCAVRPRAVGHQAVAARRVRFAGPRFPAVDTGPGRRSASSGRRRPSVRAAAAVG
ncbi:caspase family protein [uncultured Thiodictyon sp.]|uniref:caspase family protein n=1 Tax=uncultured Thiodictyon sp. TaxID=1846217 RepID=UPI0025ED5BD0|nr:caspase family protein [uncultured Thiodictyon sp.]